MPFNPVLNGISLCFHFTQSGQNWQFCLTLHKATGTVTTTDLTTAANDGQTWATGSLLGLLGNSTTLVDVTATDLSTQGGPQVINGTGGTGSGGTQHWAQSSALVISQRTALRGRSYRGRAYLGGLLYPNMANDVDVTSGYVTSIASAFGTLDATLSGHGLDVVVASGQHNKVTVSPKAINRVISYVVDAHLDSQRRRLFGRGK